MPFGVCERTVSSGFGNGHGAGYIGYRSKFAASQLTNVEVARKAGGAELAQESWFWFENR